MSKNRLETFSDAVMAIILTLLVLELRVPSITVHTNLSQYFDLLRPLFTKTLSFVLTFFIITVHWVSHHYFFVNIKSVPMGLVWLNNLFLLWICFMPFPTAMLGNNLTDQFPIILYGVNQLLAALTFMGFRSYANANGLFVNKKAAEAMGPVHSFPAVILFVLSIILSFFNVYVSLACFVIVPVLYFIPSRIRFTKMTHSNK